ncbi:MAG: hypothetical protein II574_06980 [Ruminococcus sp.]|nr:hypothetical protein [Ruminococcus sp.]
MVGSFLSGKVIAGIAAGVFAIGAATTALVLTNGSSADNSSSQVVSSSAADTSSSLVISDKDTSSQAVTTTTTTTSSSEVAAEAESCAVWTAEDLSTFVETEIRGKKIAEAKEIFKQRFGTDPDKWKVTTSGEYTSYEQDLPVGIKLYDTEFTTIWFEEYQANGVVAQKDKAVGFYSNFANKVCAEGSEISITEALKADGYELDRSTFMNRWHTSKGLVSFGAFASKDGKGKLGMVFWSPIQNAQQ